jgi:hypothetical protein
MARVDDDAQIRRLPSFLNCLRQRGGEPDAFGFHAADRLSAQILEQPVTREPVFSGSEDRETLQRRGDRESARRCIEHPREHPEVTHLHRFGGIVNQKDAVRPRIRIRHEQRSLCAVAVEI